MANTPPTVTLATALEINAALLTLTGFTNATDVQVGINTTAISAAQGTADAAAASAASAATTAGTANTAASTATSTANAAAADASDAIVETAAFKAALLAWVTAIQAATIRELEAHRYNDPDAAAKNAALVSAFETLSAALA